MIHFNNEDKSLFLWQKRLLPFIVGMIAVLTFFFFVASFIQLYYLHQKIEKSPELNFDLILKSFENNQTDFTNDERLNYIRWVTVALLEKNALQRRYHQANVLLMARVWTSYLGFVTGMILSLVGAVFILGKLRESNSKIDAETSIWKFSVTSASPGLILSLLGVTLMVITIITHFEIEVNDGPLFTPIWNTNRIQNLPTPEPLAQKDSIKAIFEEIYK